MQKHIRIKALILVFTMLVSMMSVFGTVYAENPYGYDLFGIISSSDIPVEIKDIIYGGLIDGYGEDGAYSVKSELEGEEARLIYANTLKTLLQLDCEAEDISYAILDFITFSNSHPETTDIILKYLVSGIASVDEGMIVGNLPFIKAYLETEYYSSVFVISVLKNLGSLAKMLYGEEFTIMSSYGGVLYLKNDLSNLFNDNFCEAVIGSNCPEFLGIMAGDFVSNVSASEIDAIVSYFNENETYISVEEYNEDERYDNLYEAYAESFENPQELLREALDAIDNGKDAEEVIAEIIERASTITLKADYAYTFSEVENEAIEYAYLNAQKTVELLMAEGYDFDSEKIEINIYFEKENDDGVFQVMAPSGMFILLENYGVSKLNIKTVSMTVNVDLPKIYQIIPEGAVVVMYVLQKLDVAPDSAYMTPSERPQYAFSVAADACDLEEEWENGDVVFTADLNPDGVPSAYFLREFADDRSIAEPEVWDYDKSDKILTFNVRPLKYYSFVTEEEEEKIKAGERIIKPIENKPIEFPEYEEPTPDEDDTNNEDDGWGDGSEYDDGMSGGSGGGGSNDEQKEEPPVEEEKKPTMGEISMFADLPTDHWAYKAVHTLVMYGVVNGVGENSFAPDNNVTREEFVKMLLGAVSIQTDENVDHEGVFSDVADSEWYAPFISKAKELGIVNGVSETEFGVGQKISRQDMATMVVRAAVKCGIMLTRINSDEKKTFIDNDQIDSYAKEAVSVMQTAGIINGFEDGSFKPGNFATRAEAAKIMYSVLKIVEGIKD